MCTMHVTINTEILKLEFKDALQQWKKQSTQPRQINQRTTTTDGGWSKEHFVWTVMWNIWN